MFQKIGSDVRQKVSHYPYVLGYIGRIIKGSFKFILNGRPARKILVMQLLFTFIEALPLISLISLALGTALYYLGYSFLLSIGQQSLIYYVLVVIIMQELGPLLVAFIVTARSATAIATEIAGMVTSHQIESYISFGIDPINHLVVPRFLGVTLSVFFLNLYFSIGGLLGPGIAAQFIDPVAASGYYEGIFKTLALKTIWISCIKSIFFGMVISITATYYGFSVERSSTEIPVACISAVGKSFVGIIIVDVLLIVLSVL